MALKYVTSIDLVKNELQNARVQNLAADPGTPVAGQIYYHTGSNNLRVYNGGSFVALQQGAVSDATTGAKGIVQLAGDLGGTGTTAAAPVITNAAITNAKLADGSVTGGSGAGAKIAATTVTAANIANSTITDTQVAAANKDGTAGTYSMRTLGTGAAQAFPGNGRHDQLAAPTATVSWGSQLLSNLLDPVSAQDAATKNYVDATATGLDVKASVRLATTGALPAHTRATNTLTASANAALSVDGVTPAANDRILVKDEGSGTHLENGIYKVTQVGSGSLPWILDRTTDADTTAEVSAGLFTFVEEGTANADEGWLLSTNNPITLNTTALTFVQFSSAGVITAGLGLTKTGNSLAVNVTANRTAITSNAVDIASTYVGQTSITTLGTITTGTWTGATIAVANGGTGATGAGATAAHNIGAAAVYNSASIGDGATTSFTVTHNLNNTDPVVQVYESGASGMQVFADVTKSSANAVVVAFATAPASGAYKVVVVG